MQCNYIFCELNETNDFECDFKCRIKNYRYRGKIKIDTGAEYSLLSMPRLGLSEELCLSSKKKILKDDRFSITVMQGVECTYQGLTQEDIQSWSLEEKMECGGICVLVLVNDVIFNKYSIIKPASLLVTFDKNCDNLLGMDLLRHFDFHVGVSNVTGKCTFIGCLKDRINKEYLDALLTHFGYVSQSFVEQACESVREQAYSEGIVTGYTAKSWHQLVHKNKNLRKPLKLK